MLASTVSRLKATSKPAAFAAYVFTIVIGIVCITSFLAMLYLNIKHPDRDTSTLLNVFLTTIGYIVGILTGIFGLDKPDSNE